MKKIIVVYWSYNRHEKLPYEHNQEFEYSEETRNQIINTILAVNWSVMLRPSAEQLIIWIDKYRFGQR